MNIIKYNGYTEKEIYELIIRVRNNDNEALEALKFIFKKRLSILNSNYNSELESFFYELLLKIPLDEVFPKHKIINYIFSSFLKKESKIFKSKADSPIKLNDYSPTVLNVVSSFSIDLIDDIATLKTLLLSLSEDEKKLLSLYYKYGYTEEEIGKYFNGITKAAISKRKKKTIKKLRENF